MLGLDGPSFATGVATVAAVGFMLAAAFAHRWDYRLTRARRRDRRGADDAARARRVAAATTASTSSASTWAPSRSRRACCSGRGAAASPRVRVRGERLLAGLLTLWGVHRIATQFVSAEPGSPAYLAVHAVFITLYFLSTFAVIIMVLERARSRERAAPRAPARGRAPGDGGRAGGRHGARDPQPARGHRQRDGPAHRRGGAHRRRARDDARRRSAPRRAGSTASCPTSCTSPARRRRGARPATSARWSQHVSALIRDDRSRAPRVRREGGGRSGRAALRLRSRPGHAGAVERRAQRRRGDERPRAAVPRRRAGRTATSRWR